MRELQADYRFLGTLLDGAGDFQTSADSFQEASGVVDQLLRASPDDQLLQRDMAAVQTRLGHELASAGSRKDGMPHLLRAIQTFELLSTGQKDAAATRRLGIAHSYLAQALLADGNAAGALPHFEEALRIGKSVAAAAGVGR